MPYSRLLLSTGAAPRPLPLPGADLPGVQYLRQIGDSDALRAAITTASRVVVIGAGWIGSEVAASARQLGAEVAIVAPEAVPLERVLGPEVGGIYRDLHAENGVDLHLSTRIEAIVGNGAAQGVRTTDGSVIEGDLVVVGAGVSPRDELARDAGRTLENGIVVDELLRTSAPDLFAAGDVAATWNTRYNKRIRMEHWANALNQGQAAARNMLGRDTAYTKLPYFYSDQYDLGMEYNGYATDWDRVILRSGTSAREFIAFWLKDGRVLAGMNANVWDQGDDIKALIRGTRSSDDRRSASPLVRVGRCASASAPHRARENNMIALIASAIFVGAIIGGLGRLVVRGKQDISLAMTAAIGIVAALIGTFIANALGVGSTTGIDWIKLMIQVGLAAIGVTLYTEGGRSRGRSRRR